MILKRFFSGGIKVHHEKNTANCETIIMGVPNKVVIPMLQHIGAPCEPKVKKGDSVKVGQVIGDTEKFLSAPIHSSVSGIVTDIVQILSSAGSYVTAVEIEADGKQDILGSIKPPKFDNRKEFVKIIRESGLVGLGGAGFPEHVKLSPPQDKIIDTLILNGAECEPYITSDYRGIIENYENIINGINIVMEMLKIKNTIIGIEENKPIAIRLLKDELSSNSNVKVVKLPTRYPQGAEKMLIYSLTGRKVQPGKLPSDVGVIVLNVNSCAFISSYVKTGMPLISKRITIDGTAINNPSNIRAFIGTSISDIIEFCGGVKSTPKKVLMGGPMMGIAQHSLDIPLIKQTNSVLVFDEEGAKVPESSVCIRCGSCVSVCPMKLLPVSINNNVIKKEIKELKKYHTNDCIECGACSFVCPAKIQLVQSIKLGKLILRQEASKGGN